MKEVRSFEEWQRAVKLKKMMEDLWNSNRVTNPRRPARYVRPIAMGYNDYGYEQDIYGE